MFVMLKPGWSSSSFHRSVFDEKGDRVKTMIFQPGEVYPIDEPEELAAIQSDLDIALVEVVMDDKDRPRTKDGVAVPTRALDVEPIRLCRRRSQGRPSTSNPKIPKAIILSRMNTPNGNGNQGIQPANEYRRRFSGRCRLDAR